MARIRQLFESPGEGALYIEGDEFYLIYTGESKQGWDVCMTQPTRAPEDLMADRRRWENWGQWAWGAIILRGQASEQAAARALREYVKEKDGRETRARAKLKK